MAFSWVPFYRELAERVLEFENRQDELLAVLREMQNEGLPYIPLEDTQLDGSQKPLEVIDPFTFMVNMARVETLATKLCIWLKRKWNLTTPAPTDFGGRAGVYGRGGLWFFSSAQNGRQYEDIERLWGLARLANETEVNLDANLLQACISQKNIGLRRMANGLSWINPERFLPLDETMLGFLRSCGIRADFSTSNRRGATQYLKLINKARALNPDFIALLGDAWNWNQREVDNETVTPTSNQIMLSSVSRNQILYGPPGTGKTFNVVRRAVEIIEPGFSGDFKTRFEELRSQGQIGFVTFHQSFSYEEFIEGLRPVLDDEDGQAKYEIRDGVLKMMASQAKEAACFAPSSGNFDDAWQELKRRVAGGELTHLEGRTSASRHQLVFEDDKLIGENVLSIKPHRFFFTTKANQQKAWESLPPGSIKSPQIYSLGLEGKGHSAFGSVVHNYLKEIGHHDKMDFTAPRFVLIIDEINRGNISKILGELITLLEDDKRLGEPNELRLTLPVSGETFALPPNLFILGTMNTADKSLAGLDVALRRRFSFVEMAPDFGVCDELPREMRKVLERLNERLEWAIDREHRLGHAPWMLVRTSADFNEVWREKIMPLLVELFADNLESLRDVLGDGDSHGFVRPFPKPEGMKGRDRLRLYLDCDDAREFDAFSVLKKNLGVV
jgi:hypothetical protein